jgi:hypothetical protein
MPVSSAYSSGRYRYMLPRIEIVPRLCLSTLGFHVVINTQSSRFFKLPIYFLVQDVYCDLSANPRPESVKWTICEGENLEK